MHEAPTRSRFRSFSLRTLLALMTMLAIAFGVWAFYLNQWKQQTAAVARIRALGGKPLVTNREGRHVDASNNLPTSLLHRIIGDDYTMRVPLVSLADASIPVESIRAMIPHLRKFIPEEGMNEAGKAYVALDLRGNPNIDEDLLAELRERLPNCQFVKVTPVPPDIQDAVQPGMGQREVITAVGALLYDLRTDWVGDSGPLIEMLGSMHQKYTHASGGESWAYYTDEVGIGVFGIDFDVSGTVTETWSGRGSPPPGRNLTPIRTPTRFSAYEM